MRPLVLTAAIVLVGALLVSSPDSPASAAPTIYYVDCSAKSGDGSRSRPWNSVEGVNGHGAFAPGDQVLLKRGTSCRGQLRPGGSGTSGRPIVLGAYGSGTRATVHGGGTTNRSGTIDLRNQAYWTIQDLRVTNWTGDTSTQDYRAGVSVRNEWGGALRGIVVQRMLVQDVASAPNDLGGRSRDWGGIVISAAGGQGDSFPGAIVRDNVVEHVGRTGIMVANWEWPASSNAGVRITGNDVTWTRGDGIVLYGARNSRMDNNTVGHASDQWPCPLCGGITPNTANAGLWPIFSSDIRIDHNEVYGTKALGGDGEGFDLDWDAERVVFEYNYAHDNEGGGILFCGSKDAIVRFNIFEDNGASTFAFIKHAPARNTQIYNNTVYAKSGAGSKPVRAVNGENDSDVRFFNNVVINRSDGWWQWASEANTSTAANTLVGNHGAGAPDDASTSRKDPNLRKPGSGGTGQDTLTGYKPEKSKNLQRGVSIPTSVTRDFFGKKIDPRRPPRGAAG